MADLWLQSDSGWNFDAWKARHPWQVVYSQQSGSKELIPLVGHRELRTGWEAQSRLWQHISHELLGDVSDTPPARMRHEILETRALPAYSLRRLRYTLTEQEWGYAWLLTPAGEARPRPTILALHGTTPEGKDQPVGLCDGPEAISGTAYGKELAERGYVVFAPDSIGFGERGKAHPHALYRSADQFFAAHPQASVMAKIAYDIARAVDLLVALPEVDAERIGCIGHAHGGYSALFGMVREERLRAGVVSSGFNLLRADPSPQRWWRKTCLIPRLGYYENHIYQAPMDFQQWLALIAPRPLMIVSSLYDPVFPNTQEIPAMLRRVRQVYRLYGAESDLQQYCFHGGRDFPRAARTRAYRLLEQALAK